MAGRCRPIITSRIITSGLYRVKRFRRVIPDSWSAYTLQTEQEASVERRNSASLYA